MGLLLLLLPLYWALNPDSLVMQVGLIPLAYTFVQAFLDLFRP